MGSNTCFFVEIPLQDNAHRFIQWSIAHTIWKYLSEIWHVFACYFRPTQWVFIQYSKLSKWWDRDHILTFTLLGLQHNRNMGNVFMFCRKHVVKGYIRKLKGVFMLNFCVLMHAEIVSLSQYSSCLMILENE